MPLHARELHLSPRPNCGDTEQPGTRLETSPPAPAPHLGPARSVWPPALWQMAAGWPPDPLPGHTDVGEPSGEAASRKTGRKPSPPHSHRDVVTGSRKTHTHTVSSVLPCASALGGRGAESLGPTPGPATDQRCDSPSPGLGPLTRTTGRRTPAARGRFGPTREGEGEGTAAFEGGGKPRLPGQSLQTGSPQARPAHTHIWLGRTFFFFLKSEFVANMKNLRASQQNAVLSVF